jgi:hypothetical protein
MMLYVASGILMLKGSEIQAFRGWIDIAIGITHWLM